MRIGCLAGPWAGLLAGSRSAASRQPGGGAGGSPPANGRAAPEQLQRAGARPPRRREVGRGRACSGEAAAGPDRATGGGGETMDAAAAAPRPRLLLLVLATAAATLVPGATGERRRGGAGGRLRGARAGPGLWLAPSLSQTWRGAGGAGGGAGPGPVWPGLTAATRTTGGERGRGGAGACVRARVDLPRSGRPPLNPAPRGRWRRAERSEGRAALRGARGRGPRAGGGVRPAGPGGAGAPCGVVWAPHPEREGARGSRGPGRGWGRRRFPGRGLNSEPAEWWEGATCRGDPPGHGGAPDLGPGPPSRERLFLQPGVALERGAAKLCVRRRRHEDVRNVSSFVRLGSVEVNPGTRRLQIVVVVET